MNLANLDVRGYNPKIVLVQSSSSRYRIFLEDKMKLKNHVDSNSTLDIEVRKDYKKIRDVLGIEPPFSNRWYVKIDLDKFHDKELYKVIDEANTCFFFVHTSKYLLFKNFKEHFKADTADFYVNYLRKPDFIYLYDALTSSDNKLDRNLFNFVMQSYSNDVEAVLELFIRLNQGEVFKTRKEISDVCGIGGNSVEGFLFSILNPISGSQRGLNTVMKNRVSAGIDLGKSLSFPRFYTYLTLSVERFCQLKELMMAGVVYKSVRKLPSNYDESALARYQKYLWKIKSIPTSQFMKVRQTIGYKQWFDDADFLKFIYKLYTLYSLEYLENNTVKG